MMYGGAHHGSCNQGGREHHTKSFCPRATTGGKSTAPLSHGVGAIYSLPISIIPVNIVTSFQKEDRRGKGEKEGIDHGGESWIY